MSPHPATPVEVKAAVSLLDLLLRIRQDLRERTVGPFAYIGMPDAEWMTCFVHAYAEGLGALGVEEGTEALFGSWYREVKRAWPGQGWAPVYLDEFAGDHRLAILKFLDFVAEFRTLSPEALAAVPWYDDPPHPSTRTASWLPTRVPRPTLELLREVREKIGDVPGRLSMFIGDISVGRMAGFIDGYRLSLGLAGMKDEEFPRFEQWLQARGDVPPGQTWPRPFLDACQGDAERAIRRLLGRVADFRARP